MQDVAVLLMCLHHLTDTLFPKFFYLLCKCFEAFFYLAKALALVELDILLKCIIQNSPSDNYDGGQNNRSSSL